MGDTPGNSMADSYFEKIKGKKSQKAMANHFLYCCQENSRYVPTRLLGAKPDSKESFYAIPSMVETHIWIRLTSNMKASMRRGKKISGAVALKFHELGRLWEGQYFLA